ncbi:MAG: hypothetical protein ACHQAZ_07385, partial [Gammaproteobacteria bacterium]
MPSPEELASRREYFLYGIDMPRRECEFLHLDPGAYRDSAFLDHRLKSDNRESFRTPLDGMTRLLAGSAASSRPINYIFHTSFCCSTLISRCLDMQGACCGLREPAVLMQVANEKRIAGSDAGWPQTLDTTLGLLSKCRAPGEAMVMKPTNAANNLAEDVLGMPQTGGVLLLHSNLRYFLVSILKKGEKGRAFVRMLFGVIRVDSERTRSLDPEALSRLTDLQIAAFTWYAQMDSYLRLLERFPARRIATLDCDAFLADPLTTLAKLSELFSIEASREELQQVVTGSLFTKSSK